MKNISPSLILHFLSFILYLFFFRIIKDTETMILFKPVILASIAYYYINQSRIKKHTLHFVIIGLCFISDNMNLFGEVFFHELSMGLYLIVLFVLLYLIVKDSKLIVKGSSFEKYFGVIITILVLLFVFTKLTSTYVLKTKIHHYYLILNYIVVFLSVLILSFYNFFKRKTLSSKFLVATLICLFLADLFSVINAYYFPFKSFVYISCLFELPIYYFLITYFINRDLEIIK
ncbi:MAG: hypothetical protein ACJAYP_000709 [Flavobacterium sp.]|jgi:hypothetical protein